MTQAQQPEALRLADNLEGNRCHRAAAMLRTQHARIAELEAATAAQAVEPVAEAAAAIKDHMAAAVAAVTVPAELLGAPAAVAVPERWCPDVCPITGRPFFMWVTHHDTGEDVPTYGGPFDSYTIPTKDKDGTYSCERYDHDLGGWREWEGLGLMLVDDQSLVIAPDNARYNEIEAFAALAATPPAPSLEAAAILEAIAEEAPINGNVYAHARVLMAANRLREAARQADAPQAQDVQRDALDAARYRWLRDESTKEWRKGPLVFMTDANGEVTGFEPLLGTDLDEEISVAAPRIAASAAQGER